MNKWFKRIIALALSLSTLAPACVFAYTPGPREYQFKFDNIISLNNAVKESKGIRIGAGGSASMDLLLPFTAAKIELEYTAVKDTELTVSTGRNTYIAPLSAKETKATMDILNEEVADLVLTLSASSEVFIKSFVFIKEDADIAPTGVNAVTTMTQNQETLCTAVGISPSSVVLFDHGAMRYLDFDETRTTAKFFDGVLYLPAFALARALDMYIEDYSDMEYVFLRTQDDKIEIRYQKGETYRTTGGFKTKIDLSVKYADGLTWLPVKRVAELVEKTALEKDGIIVIDNKLQAQKIINDTAAFSELQSNLARYELQDNSDAKVYHVSKDRHASDRNPGTEAHPFETISKAAELAKPGDTVIIHGGTYAEAVVPKNSGEPSKPIRYMAAEGEEVIISNIAELSGFGHYKDDIWCVKVPKQIGTYRLQVFHNGEGLTQGRHPNTHNQDKARPYFEGANEAVLGVHGDITIPMKFASVSESVANTGKFYAVSEKGLLNQTEKDYWKGASWIGLKGQGWTVSTAPVTGSEYGKVFLEDGGNIQGTITYFWHDYEFDWGYLTNHINTLDVPGEWYYDGKTLYIIPPEGVDGKDLTVSVKQGFLSFDLTDKSFIELHGINTKAASVTMNGETEHNVINGGTHEYISYTTFAGTQINGIGYNEYAEVEEDTAENGSMGFYINGNNNAIVNTKIMNSATSCINITGKSNYTFIYNNEINGAGTFMGDTAIRISGNLGEGATTGGHQLINNTLANCGAHAVDMSNVNSKVFEAAAVLPMEFAYNHFYNSTLYGRDSGAFYSWLICMGHDREFTQVHHNLIHDAFLSRSSIGSVIGFYFDNVSIGVDCHNNVIYWSNKDYEFTPVFVQKKSTFPDTYSTVPNYANKSLAHVEEHITMKNSDQLPTGKPFFIGADHATNGRFIENGKFMGNLENYDNNYDSIYVSEAVLSDGATFTDDGFALFNQTGKVTFKDVDLTGKNNLVAYIAGNEAIKNYVLRLEIIDQNGKVVETDPAALILTSDNSAGVNELEMRIMNFTGKHDIVLSVDDKEAPANELKIARLKANSTDKPPVLPFGSEIIYGGAFTGQVHHTLERKEVQSHYELTRYEDRTHHYANWIFGNTIIYEDVRISRDFTDIISYVQAQTGDLNYYMQVRIGSETAEPIAEFDLNFVPEIEGGRPIEGYVWRKMTQTLKEPLKAGTYDFYVTFRVKEGDHLATADLAYFGFFNQSEQMAE